MQVPHVPARPLDFSTRTMPFETPARSSAFIAAVPITPNATIGLGRFYSMPRRRLGTQEQPILQEAKKPRRAAVGLSLRF
jgi:hypothetical protein